MGPAPALHSSRDLDGHRGHVPPKPLADLLKATMATEEKPVCGSGP